MLNKADMHRRGSIGLLLAISSRSKATKSLGNIQNLVDAMAAFSPPTLGETMLAVATLDVDLNLVIVAN